jgi:hypothetical protein
MLKLEDLTPEVMSTIIASSTYIPIVVEHEPVTRLTQWQVYEVTYSGATSVHLMGWAEYEGRVSSPVKEYTSKTKTAVTASGRLYKLVGSPGHNKDAMYVFNTWIRRFPEGTPYKEITNEYE